METLSYGSAPCYQVVNTKTKSIKNSLNSTQSRVSYIRKHGVYHTNNLFSFGSLRFYDDKVQQLGFRSKVVFEGSKRFQFQVYSGSYGGDYVISEDESRDISVVGEPASKVLIPGLPDESNGDSGAIISSCFKGWKPKLNVHYEKAGFENVDSPNVLFLPGFGVGSFHYEKQLKDLGRDFRVWALDFLGQGMSLPFEDPAPLFKEKGVASSGNVSSWGFGDETEPWATELVYSVDLWQDQVRYFIEEVNDFTLFCSNKFLAFNPMFAQIVYVKLFLANLLVFDFFLTIS